MWNIVVIAAAACALFGLQFSVRYIRARRLKSWFSRGMAHYQNRRFTDALRAFRKCVRIAPEWLHARTLMSISLAQAGQREEALHEIDMVRALQPGEAETWTLIATFYITSMPEDEDRIFEALERLAALDTQAFTTIIKLPAFRRYHGTLRLQELQQQANAS